MINALKLNRYKSIGNAHMKRVLGLQCNCREQARNTSSSPGIVLIWMSLDLDGA